MSREFLQYLYSLPTWVGSTPVNIPSTWVRFNNRILMTLERYQGLWVETNKGIVSTDLHFSILVKFLELYFKVNVL